MVDLGGQTFQKMHDCILIPTNNSSPPHPLTKFLKTSPTLHVKSLTKQNQFQKKTLLKPFQNFQLPAITLKSLLHIFQQLLRVFANNL